MKEIFDYRQNDLLDELNVAVDSLSVRECKRIFDFIRNLNENTEIDTEDTIFCRHTSDASEILEPYAERYGTRMELESLPDGSLTATVHSEGILSILREDVGMKTLLTQRESEMTVLSGSNQITCALIIMKKDRPSV